MRTQSLLGLGAAALLAPTTACTDITALEQVNPGQVSAATLYVPANAQLLVNGAISDFECAYTRYVVGSGLLIDELSNAIGSTANFDFDARRLITNASYGTGGCASGFSFGLGWITARTRPSPVALVLALPPMTWKNSVLAS